MTTLPVVTVARVELTLDNEQLNRIATQGKRDLANGRIFGDEEYDNDDSTEYGELNNGTTKVLNALIANLKDNPIPIARIEKMINGNGNDVSLMKRFGDLFFLLTETQIYTQNGENGIPSGAYKISYPLRDALEKLEQHKLREWPGTTIANGFFTEGCDLFEQDEEWPVYDFMFDEDPAIVDCFWYIVKLISLVI
jgi:hypothetical protein